MRIVFKNDGIKKTVLSNEKFQKMINFVAADLLENFIKNPYLRTELPIEFEDLDDFIILCDELGFENMLVDSIKGRILINKNSSSYYRYQDKGDLDGREALCLGEYSIFENMDPNKVIDAKANDCDIVVYTNKDYLDY